ncbi:hypothetical protein [Algoriphagus persicinus]|uniref:hypothetical protein n=1 Tax=Algoriphagus persicinus TaxID=3108754 RepID=UPI002B3674B5|nr:hypothetical protein [Algoriphagus sp. E1-3-M2]MEB2784150.1 hypothetical protein [Algoriphagus sp. E1-3-M2]
MKTLFKSLVKASIVAAMSVAATFYSFAQTEPLGPLMSVTEFTIKPGHDLQFQEGVKAWKECYLSEKGEWTWRMWQRQQGDGNVYVLTSDMQNWAEMDISDSVGKNCAALATSMINPHVEKATNHITRLLPAVSKTSPTENEVISVSFYELSLSHGYLFLPMVREVLASVAKAEGDYRGYWYSWLTMGPESPNYHYVIPFKNFAEMDIVKDGVWDIYEKEHGKAKRDSLQTNFRLSVKNTWLYQYKLNTDMSRPIK